MVSKALPEGSLLKGGKNVYRIESVLIVDGQGFAYKAKALVSENGQTLEVPVVVREQMMVRCSSRGEDGITVVTPEDLVPTVKSCLESFIYASREREKLSELSPWIINVLDIFAANNTFYYVVDYLDGETFAEYVERMGGHLTFEQARKVLSPIFDAVMIMHRHRALHTDIHPGHIRFVSRGGATIPVLFSLYNTLHFTDSGLQRWTLPMMACSEGFAPPEQYFEIDHFSPQIDIYALGAMLVFALSGKRLPDSRKVTEELVRSYLPPSLPEMIVQAILNALDHDLTRRTSTITKFRTDLGTFQGVVKPDHSLSLIDEVRSNAENRSILDRILHFFHVR